ncbi:MAG: galactose-1-epimerase, partial [Muribaculaceae bacterium]|nr:galactose-1-epimerase [Muribaculaceae bacterium]
MRKTFWWLSLVVLINLLLSCKERNKEGATLSGLDSKNFETVIDGDSVRLIVLRNRSGMEVCLSNYG